MNHVAGPVKTREAGSNLGRRGGRCRQAWDFAAHDTLADADDASFGRPRSIIYLRFCGCDRAQRYWSGACCTRMRRQQRGAAGRRYQT